MPQISARLKGPAVPVTGPMEISRGLWGSKASTLGQPISQNILLFKPIPPRYFSGSKSEVGTG